MEDHGHSKVFVGNLPFKISNEDLEQLFRPFGQIIGVSIRKDRLTNKPKGFAFVSFATADAAPEAIRSMHGYVFAGRPLTVNLADKRGGKDESGGDDHESDGEKGAGGGSESTRRVKKDNSWKTVPDPPRNSSSTSVAKSEKSKQAKSWTSWAGPA